jgi:hypothetical protein
MNDYLMDYLSHIVYTLISIKTEYDRNSRYKIR